MECLIAIVVLYIIKVTMEEIDLSKVDLSVCVTRNDLLAIC